MRASNSKALQKKRDTIDRKVAEFLAAGGVIQSIPRGKSGIKLEVRKGKDGRTRWQDPQRKSQIRVATRKSKRNRR